MTKRLAVALLLGWVCGGSAWACVGKTVVVGAVETPQGQVLAQVFALLINERTGTTVKIEAFSDLDALHRGLATGDVDLAVERAGSALQRLGLEPPGDAEEAFSAAKAEYLKRLNLVWLPPLGFGGAEREGLAAPVARKATLKKFPALPRLIAKTQGLLSEPVVAELASQPEPARAAREFLRERKLI